MGVTANKVLDVARKWIGYTEANGKFKEILDVYNSHTPLARGYKIKTTDAWCDAFVSAVAIKAGAVDLIGTEVGVPKHVAIFQNKGIWIEDGSQKPKPGDIIVFNWDDSTQSNDGAPDHIGFVESVVGTTITTIEGNMSNGKVARRTINIGWGYIRGFARPKYDEEPVVAPVVKKTVNQLAEEVLQGVWGNGAVRKNALIKAGYDYTAVQARVNEILSGATKKKSDTTVAKEVIAGKWGNGKTRMNSLKKAGYNANVIQNLVNTMLKK